MATEIASVLLRPVVNEVMATKKKQPKNENSKKKQAKNDNWQKMIKSAGSYYFPVTEIKKLDGPTIPPTHKWKQPEWKNRLLFLYVFFEEKTKKYVLPPVFLPFNTTAEEIDDDYALARAKEGARNLFQHYLGKQKQGIKYSLKIIVDANGEPYDKFFEAFLE